MKWIAGVAVVAVVIVGLILLAVLRSRSGVIRRPTTPERGAAAQAARDATSGGMASAPGLAELGRHEADAYAESTRRLAQNEAAMTLQLAERDADARRRAAESEAESLVRAARSDADIARAAADAATESARRSSADAERILRAERAELTRDVERDREQLARRSAELEARAAQLLVEEGLVERRRDQAVQRENDLQARAAELEDRAGDLDRRGREHAVELERISELSSADAKTELLRSVEVTARREAAVLTRSIEAEARSTANDRARQVIVEAVQRCASEQTSETVVSVMALPSDDMKGRIIGREGRNIRSFESVTGVNIIIDDTPEAVLLSCFDPGRREVGRLTLEKLILDGRIHPHRIEEAYEQSKAEVDALCLRAATDALADVGIRDLDERLLPTLGRLKYRTSYGQNVLAHLVETAHISGVMAAELGLDPVLIKRCAFLHDIGKALTHEVQGSHAIIGAELLRKYGESEAVAHAVEAHHNEVLPRTIEAVLTQAADACSAARPGARRETLESYVKRLERIEEIASTRGGVEKVFAMQAGREVRVMVQPESIDDLEAAVMAREIAKQIEDELTYPGQIRVTVVRESRATEVAH